MAQIKVTIPRQESWLPTDKVQLVIGSENAASLAASTPAGGRVVREEPAFPDAAAKADENLGDLVMIHTYNPTDVCAELPVGVQSVDEHGNVSTISEQLVHLKDPPRGVRDTTVDAVSDGEGGFVQGAFKVTFTQSKHITAG